MNSMEMTSFRTSSLVSNGEGFLIPVVRNDNDNRQGCDQSCADSSIPILRILILCPCFLVVAPLTKRLPVFPVPEEHHVTSVRCDMVHNRSLGVFPLLQTSDAEGMGFQVFLACLLPSTAITTRACTPYLFRMQWLVFLTELRSCRHQFRAVRMLAGDLWFRGHQSSPSFSVQFIKSLGRDNPQGI